MKGPYSAPSPKMKDLLRNTRRRKHTVKSIDVVGKRNNGGSGELMEKERQNQRNRNKRKFKI